jgi:hypothetical protein
MIFEGKKPSYGLLTYFAEGSSNPYSPNFSRKIRLTRQLSLVIGRGYDLKDVTEYNAINDLMAAGVKEKMAESIAKGCKLVGNEAKKFYLNNEKSIFISPDQDLALFNLKMQKVENDLRNVL